MQNYFSILFFMVGCQSTIAMILLYNPSNSVFELFQFTTLTFLIIIHDAADISFWNFKDFTIINDIVITLITLLKQEGFLINIFPIVVS